LALEIEVVEGVRNYKKKNRVASCETELQLTTLKNFEDLERKPALTN
jgi:hypothetical protein